MAKKVDIKDLKGVNYDFIEVLKMEDGRLKIETHSIHHDNTLITTLLDLVNDESATVSDMVSIFNHHIKNTEDFNYCICNPYNERYISQKPHTIPPIPFPKPDKYEEAWDNFYTTQKEEVTNKVLKENLGKPYLSLCKDIEEILNLRTLAANISLKQKFYIKSIPYIFAVDYDSAKRKVEMLENVICYTNETYCRSKYYYPVNDDINIKIETNFCFGSSSFFTLVVNYKGIDLLPYSFWVRYYYARIEELLSCTRNYVPSRYNWTNCFSFIQSYVNKAIDSPDVFIKEEVISEVNKLLDGLEELAKESDDSIKEKMRVEPPKDNEPKYVGICAATQSDVEIYRAYPKELPLVYRMEKITGALRFLKSLYALSEIVPDVKNSITRIKDINSSVYHEIIESIPPMVVNIKLIEQSIKRLEYRLKPSQNKFDKLEAILDKWYDKYRYEKSQDEIKKQFDKRYPSYDDLETKTIDLKNQINNLEWHLSKRRIFLKKMEHARDLIEHYVLKTDKT